jgi:acetyl esterase/lipase
MRQLVEASEAQTIKSLGSLSNQVKQRDLTYTTRDGAELSAILYQPINPPSNGSPLVVIFHGGGFCVGSPKGEEHTCQNLVSAFGATCVSASYRLAPKFKFPYGVKDAWDCLQWAAREGRLWGADPSVGFIVGGTSAGGNIAAVLAHVARDERMSPPLTGQYLAIPKLLPWNRVPEKYREHFLSPEDNKDAPILPVAAVEAFERAFEPDDDDAVWYAVFNHPNHHANLPPTLLQVNGMDPLRDEAIIYERVLREELGIKTQMYMYPGLPHGFWAIFGSLQSSQKFRREQVEGFGWLLNRKPEYSNVVSRIS